MWPCLWARNVVEQGALVLWDWLCQGRGALLRVRDVVEQLWARFAGVSLPSLRARNVVEQGGGDFSGDDATQDGKRESELGGVD